MMRFLGVIVGSAIAVAALVVFVGIPEFTTESSVAESTVITLPMRVETPSPEPVAEAPQEAVPAAAAVDPPAARQSGLKPSRMSPRASRSARWRTPPEA